jgi:uncharacterized protein (DUF4415 family)
MLNLRTEKLKSFQLAISVPEKPLNKRFATMKNTLTQTDWKQLESLSDDKIDTSDIPELDESFFTQAQLRQVSQQTVNLKLDTDIIKWFKEQGLSYQTQANRLLRHYMQSQQLAHE